MPRLQGLAAGAYLNDAPSDGAFCGRGAHPFRMARSDRSLAYRVVARDFTTRLYLLINGQPCPWAGTNLLSAAKATAPRKNSGSLAPLTSTVLVSARPSGRTRNSTQRLSP